MSKLEPGRELDALIAEKVLNKKLHRYETSVVMEDPLGFNFCVMKDGKVAHRFPGNCLDIPRYSTSIQYAWLVVEKLIGGGWIYYRLTGYKKDDLHFHSCLFEGAGQGQPTYTADGRTAPHAICLASLKAVGFEMEGE